MGVEKSLKRLKHCPKNEPLPSEYRVVVLKEKRRRSYVNFRPLFEVTIFKSAYGLRAPKISAPGIISSFGSLELYQGLLTSTSALGSIMSSTIKPAFLRAIK